MKFSIIVPIYNREIYIQQVINSVLEQTYSDWELLLIDDGSTDGTATICKRNSGNDNRIQYIYKSNGGVSSARNYGIKIASGDFIVFLDSDNTLTNNALEALYRLLQETKHVDFIVFGFNISASSKWLPSERGPELIVNRDSIRRNYLPTHFNIYVQDKCFFKNFVWNKAFSRTFLQNNHLLFDESRHTWEDGIFVINCLDKANRIVVLPETIYNAYCEQQIEHLSSKLYLDQVLQYINDEQEYLSRFSDEISFSTEHYITTNIKFISSMFDAMVRKYGYDALPVIEKAISTEIVKWWAELFMAKDKEGKLFRKYVLNGEASKIYGLYKSSFIKRVIKKLHRSLISNQYDR